MTSTWPGPHGDLSISSAPDYLPWGKTMFTWVLFVFELIVTLLAWVFIVLSIQKYWDFILIKKEAELIVSLLVRLLICSVCYKIISKYVAIMFLNLKWQTWLALIMLSTETYLDLKFKKIEAALIIKIVIWLLNNVVKCILQNVLQSCFLNLAFVIIVLSIQK